MTRTKPQPIPTREQLPDDPELLKDLLVAASGAIVDLEHQVAWFERMLWGRKSERVVPEGQGELFAAKADPAPAPTTDDNSGNDDVPPKMPKERAKTKRGGKRKQKRRGFDDVIPPGLPEIVTRHTLAEQGCVCGTCGGELEVIHTDRRRRVEWQPGRFVVRVEEVESGVCRAHDNTVVTAEGEQHALRGSLYGDAFLVKVLVDKYADNIPLNRQARRFLRKKLRVSSATLSRLVLAASGLLHHIVIAMRRELIESAWLQGDATGLPILLGDRGATHRGHLWVYTNGETAVFDVSMTKHGAFPKAFLEGFEGVFVADGTSEYNDLEKQLLGRGGCWSHARRGLFEARNDDVAAYEGIELIRQLFALERELKTLDATERQDRRKRDATPILEQLRAWLDEQRAREDVKLRRRSPFTRALNYLHNQWERLSLFAHRGDIELHNNRSELLLRNPVIGRKNWLFAGSPEGAVANAILASIMASCMLQGIDPSAYLNDVLPRLPGMKTSEVAANTPARWAERYREELAHAAK